MIDDIVSYKRTFILVVFACCVAPSRGLSKHDAWMDELILRTRDKLDELSRALPKTEDPAVQERIVTEMAQFVAEINEMQSKINKALSQIDRDKFNKIFGRMNKQAETISGKKGSKHTKENKGTGDAIAKARSGINTYGHMLQDFLWTVKKNKHHANNDDPAV